MPWVRLRGSKDGAAQRSKAKSGRSKQSALGRNDSAYIAEAAKVAATDLLQTAQAENSYAAGVLLSEDQRTATAEQRDASHRFVANSAELGSATADLQSRDFSSLSGPRNDGNVAPETWSGMPAAQFNSDINFPLRNHARYQFISNLNRGSSGFVQHARDTRTGMEVAIKFIYRGLGSVGFDARHITRELLNHRLAGRHPNIVQLLEVFVTDHHLAIVMEMANGGDLSELIDERGNEEVGGFPEEDAAWFFQQLVCAVDFCHRLGIANRDIKLDNMLLHGRSRRPMLRICDFGYSKDEMGQSVSKSTCGTPEYMAPEVLFESKYDGKKADVWSCGVSLFVMLTGEFPFARPEDQDASNVVRMQRMFARIIQGNMQPAPRLSPAALDLLGRMLQPDPEQRATLAEVATHPWLSIVRNNLPPLKVNDQLIACMDKFGAGARGGCRQGAAEIVKLVSFCAADMQQLGMRRRDMHSQSQNAVRSTADQLSEPSLAASSAAELPPESQGFYDPSTRFLSMTL